LGEVLTHRPAAENDDVVCRARLSIGSVCRG